MICTIVTTAIIILVVAIYGYTFYFVYLYFFKHAVFLEKLNISGRFGQKLQDFILKLLPFLDYRKIQNKILRFIAGLILFVPWFFAGLTAAVFIIIGTFHLVGAISSLACSV